MAVSANGAAFLNPSSVGIPDSSVGSPYPSEIAVSGLGNDLTGITVDLFGFVHTATPDIQIALESPAGTVVLLMGRNSGYVDDGIPTPLNLTFDDAAVDPLPFFENLASQSYRPTSFDADTSFTAPGPEFGSWTTTFSSFHGENPNGTWRLYVEDFVGGDAGSIANGWQVNVTAVPEPGEVAVAAGVGLAVLAGVRRWRRRRG